MANPNPHQAHEAIRAKALRGAEQLRWFIEPLHAQGLNYAQIARTCEAYRLKPPGDDPNAQWYYVTARKIVKRLGLVRHDQQAAA